VIATQQNTAYLIKFSTVCSLTLISEIQQVAYSGLKKVAMHGAHDS